MAQKPPITVDDNVDLLGTGIEVFGAFSDDERNTCDPEFWDVVKDRAWMEAQRELTQNWNYVDKPDSVMALGCFDLHMDRLGTYGDNNFPRDPGEAGGESAAGTYNNISMSARIRISLTHDFQNVDLDPIDNPTQPGYESQLQILGDAYFAGGVFPYGLLELLVMDQLVEDATLCGAVADNYNIASSGDPIATASAAACMVHRGTLSGGCAGLAGAGYHKAGFIEDNFSSYALGGRAITAGTYSEIRTSFDGEVRDNVNNFNACNIMSRVWERAKCYDFAMESTRYTEPERFAAGANQDTSVVPPNLNYGTVDSDRDGFYSLDRYREVADANSDFRRGRGFVNNYGSCERPDDNYPVSDLITGLDVTLFACDIFEHGLSFPDPASLSTAISLFSAFIPFPDRSPTWSTAHDGANPDIGASGAPDEYVDYLELRGEAAAAAAVPPGNCGYPVKTGYIVINKDGTSYEDAFCTVPGCWFEPPGSVGADGTCTQ